MTVDLDKLLSLSVADKAWAAGFIDGEGCIIINKSQGKRSKSPSYTLRLTVVQKYPKPLEKLHDMFGGRLGVNSVGVYEWHADGETATVLKVIKDYLVLKHEQAETAIAFHRHKTDSPRAGKGKLPTNVIDVRESFKKRLSDLKRMES